jgi:quercetin dioxygenase-like cupin family protein
MRMPETNEFSPLLAALGDLPETAFVPAKFRTGGSFGAQIVYGKESSLMVATHQPGFHSEPHSHDSEQLSYVLQGELLVFIDEEGFVVKKGDAFRVPRKAIHWSWVQGTEPSILLECHFPPLIGDDGVVGTAKALLKPSEATNDIQMIRSDWANDIDRDEAERNILMNLISRT